MGQSSTSCHHPGNDTQIKPRGAGARRTCGENLKNIHEEQCSETKDVKKPEVCTPISEKLAQMRKQLAAMVKTPDEDDCIDPLFASLPSSHQLAINDVSASS